MKMQNSISRIRIYGSFLAAAFLFLMAVATARADYQSIVVGDQPLAYYPLNTTADPTADGVAHDLSGNSYNGTYTANVPAFNSVPGPSPYISEGLNFDGAVSRVDLTNTTVLNFGGIITMEAWAQPASPTVGSGPPADILAKGYDGTNEMTLRANGGYYFGGTYNNDAGGRGASGGVESTNWVHLVSTFDGTNWNLYVNGVLVQTNADTTGAINFTAPWAIGDGSTATAGGNSGDLRYFQGNLAQVALYTSALTPSQVFTHYFFGMYGVMPSNSVPVITVQPTPQVGYLGGSATFNVTVLSVLPTTNQWYRNGSPITGQTNAMLVLSNISPGDAANYSVVVGNSNGTTNSVSASLTLTTLKPYESTVAADQPLAYYPLDSSIDTSTSARDLSGNGNNGVYFNTSPGFNSAVGPTPYITNAANFVGSSPYQTYADLSMGPNASLLNFSGPITMEAWVQPSSTTWFGDIMAKGYDANTYAEIYLRLNGPYGNVYSGSSGSAGITAGAQTTNWTYVVLSSDGTNCSLYLNGALIQQVVDTTGSTMFSDDWCIGNGSSAGATRFFSGNLSQVAIYNHGLTASQVLTHYYMGVLNSNPTNAAPIIVSQPQPQSVFFGGTATFSVGVVSGLPTTNLWFKNGVPMPGKTNATLVISGAGAGDVANYSVVVGNTKGTTNSASAALSVVPAGNSLRWTGANSSTWDTGISTNWLNTGNSQPSAFQTNDQVLFDDTPLVPTTVGVSGTVLPSLITVNSSTNNFLLNGSGQLTGAGSLVKNGSSTLTLNVPVSGYTASVAINGGKLVAGNFALANATSITITNNSTMDFAGSTMVNHTPITVSGVGVGGAGAIVNSVFDLYGQVLNITLAGDTTFGGGNRWDLAAGSQINSSGAHSLVLNWGYGEWNTITIGANVTGITLTNGNFGSKFMDAGFQNPATVFTVSPNCQLVYWNGGWNGSLHLLSGGKVTHLTAPSGFKGSNITLENGATFESYGNTGSTTPVNSAITLNGIANFNFGDHNMVFTNLISGLGGFVWTNWNHQMVLSAPNTYTGPTIIGAGPQVALTGNGSIAHSSLIFFSGFGGNSSSTVHVDVSGRPDQTLTLASGQTLGGIGTINGSLAVASGATLSPAGTNTTAGVTTATNATGAIVATNAVTLNGTTVLKLNGSGINDQVQAGAGITYGGTLNLVNISGAPLVAGNSFQIFSAATYLGSFANVTPATPGPGLSWQLNNGLLTVVQQPIINNVRVSSGNVIFSGTNGASSGSYVVLTTTNLTTPRANWVPLSTNNFDTSGNFSVTNAIVPGVPDKFYLIKQ